MLPNKNQIGKCCNMTLKLKKWSNIFVSYLFFTFVQNFKPKKKKKKRKKDSIVTCVFECFQSYCCILKELHDFLCMIVAMIIFGENDFIFSFVGYMDWWQNHLRLGAHLRKWQRKQNVKKMNVNIFTIKLGWIIWPSFRV